MTPDDEGLRAAIHALENGEPIVLPTDTVYGLAVKAGDPHALDLLFQLKRRPAERSIAVLVATVDQASLIAEMNDHERRIADACWPGALTLVLDRLATADPSLGRDDGTVGVRCPNHDFVRLLAAHVGPLATTSANLSGEPTPAEAHAAASTLDGEIAVVIDDGPCEGQASSVARIANDGTITVFRQGEISQHQLHQLLF